jgi:hypothetical protein
VARPRSNGPCGHAKRTVGAVRATIGQTPETVTPVGRRNHFVSAGHAPGQLPPASGPRNAGAHAASLVTRRREHRPETVAVASGARSGPWRQVRTSGQSAAGGAACSAGVLATSL